MVGNVYRVEYKIKQYTGMVILEAFSEDRAKDLAEKEVQKTHGNTPVKITDCVFINPVWGERILDHHWTKGFDIDSKA